MFKGSLQESRDSALSKDTEKESVFKKMFQRTRKKREIVLVFSMERSIFGKILASLFKAEEENKSRGIKLDILL